MPADEQRAGSPRPLPLTKSKHKSGMDKTASGKHCLLSFHNVQLALLLCLQMNNEPEVLVHCHSPNLSTNREWTKRHQENIVYYHFITSNWRCSYACR